MKNFFCACSRDATCLGRYETGDGPFEFACDICCGHGCEDGICYPIGELSESTIAKLVDDADRRDYGL